MSANIVFREIREAEIPQMFELIRARIAWMDEQGMRSWNTTNYLQRYPLEYYAEEARRHQLFVLADESRGKLLSAAVLLRQDERWSDNAPAIYIHNFVSAFGEKGAGSLFLQHTEAHARRLGLSLVRLDSIENNAAISAYYDSRGYAAVGKCEDGPYHGVLREKRLP